jgi:hypothetical protein
LGTFVANKDQTAIRPNGDRAVEAVFSPSIDLESASIFLLVPIADFTRPDCRFYSLINKLELRLPPAFCLPLDCYVVKDLWTQVRLSGSNQDELYRFLFAFFNSFLMQLARHRENGASTKLFSLGHDPIFIDQEGVSMHIHKH